MMVGRWRVGDVGARSVRSQPICLGCAPTVMVERTVLLARRITLIAAVGGVADVYARPVGADREPVVDVAAGTWADTVAFSRSMTDTRALP